jgi:hypothetical protein
MRRRFAGWAESLARWCSINLGEGVLTPNIYEPALNQLYRDVLLHYGVVSSAMQGAGPGSQR